MPIHLQKLDPWAAFSHALPWLALGLGLFLTAGSWRASRRDAQRFDQYRFQLEVERQSEHIRDRMRDCSQLLRSVRLLFGSSEQVEPEEWSRFVDGLALPREYPGVQRIGLIEPLRLQAGLQSRASTPHHGSAEQPSAASESRLDWRLVYFEPGPVDASQLLHRPDLANPDVCSALRRSCDSDCLATAVSQVRSAGSSRSILLVLPIYANGATLATVGERRDALESWACVDLDLAELSRDDVCGTNSQVRLQIDGGNTLGKQVLLCDSRPAEPPPDRPRLTSRHALQVGGEEWMLCFSTLPGFDAASEGWTQWMVLAVGICVSVLLSATVWMAQHMRLSAEKLANDMTASLQLREAEARELALVASRSQQGLEEYARALEQANHCLEEYTFTAQAATRAKSELLANMSHELRTPLTSILGFAEVLRNEGDIAKAPRARIEAIDTILRNGEHLLRLINDVLDLSKIEAGRFEIERCTCSLVQIVGEVQRLVVPRAREKHLAVQVQYLTRIPETIVSDPTRVRQILINLLGNAVKFTERGCVRLEVRCLDAEGPDPRIELAVIDTGIGMDGKQLAAIFEPFVQAHKGRGVAHGGTGLGLAISRKLAGLLGGTIDAESAPGVGSTFRLTLPTGSLAGVPMVDVSLAQCTAETPAAGSQQVDVAAPIYARILLADDGADNRRLISFLLRKAGVDVIAVEDGQMAIDAALSAVDQQTPFDLILMDIQMPVVDGYEATRQLRACGYRRPIVALTAHAMKDDRRKCLEAGCDDYATKPIQRAALLALVARFAAPAENVSNAPA
ncbi:MAG: ATP-binding protein [Planctomycetota bacterium]